MSEAAILVGHTALLIVDLQNDFLHSEGAYGRAGQGAAEIAALPERLKPLPTCCAPMAAMSSQRSLPWCRQKEASR